MLLRGARQLLTLRGPSGVRRGSTLHDLAIIEDGSVLIRDGLIAEVGSSRRVENLKEARQALAIPVHGAVLMPGFVDASIGVSLQNSAADAPRRRKSPSQFHDEILALMRACLQHGTLTADVKASSGMAGARSNPPVLRQLRKIGDHPVRTIRTWRCSAETIHSPEPDGRVDRSTPRPSRPAL